MEIGGFIELQFPKGREYHKESSLPEGMGIARLNSGRAGIYHAIRCLGCDTVYLPYYQCDTVREFLKKKGITVKYYYIGRDFTPLLDSGAVESNAAVLVANYYGVMSGERMASLAARYEKSIVDHSQAFFAEPVSPGKTRCMNVYSARKFIGVPDGSYVIGRCADRFVEEYDPDFSSDTSLFLLQRIEYGCEGKAYEGRMLNEKRIDQSDIKRMSALTRTILDGTDYNEIKKKRRENFGIAHELFHGINQIDPVMHYGDACIPMIYPLVVEDDGLLGRMISAKHFQGHWWSYLVDEMDRTRFEHWISRYIIPITIDQRYGGDEIRLIRGLIE